MILDIGRYREKEVTVDVDNLLNSHVALIGTSGCGKSVQCQRMICSAVKQGGTICIFDSHNTFADDQIFWKYKDFLSENIKEINAEKAGILCDLFTPLQYADGTMEDPIDTVGALTNVLEQALRLGCMQKAEIRHAIQTVYENQLFEEMGIAAIDLVLSEMDGKRTKELREKLYPLTAHNVFRPGSQLLENGKINIFRLSRYDLATQEIIMEILLSYIWRLANAGQFQNKLFVFVDECQNLASGKNSVLAQMLSEGRKFNISLMLATQLISEGSMSVVQHRMTQCGLMLYFRPAGDKVNATARLIDSNNERDWSKCLRQLGVGEFIAVGSFRIDGRPKNGAIKVSAVETKEPLQKPVVEKKIEGGRGTVTMYEWLDQK